MKTSIIVGQRGFVWVGRVEYGSDDVVLYDSRTVIRWGTSDGLEELAAKGPLQNTKLSARAPSTRRIHRLAVVQDIECEEGPWASAL